MFHWNTLAIIALFICLQIRQMQGEYLGANLLKNSDFQSPTISPSVLSWTQQFSNGITGWNCTNKCKIGKLSSMCLLGLGSLCSLASGGQLINLQSSSRNEEISQIFEIESTGLYQLTFFWLPPQSGGLRGKYVDILITGTLIGSIKIDSSNYQLTQFSAYSIRVNLTSTTNEIRLAMKGTYDGQGILIDNITIQQVIANQSANSNSTIISNNTSNHSSANNSSNETSNNQTINNITDTSSSIDNTTLYKQNLLVYSDFLFENKLMKMSNSIPGGRIYLKIILDFFPNFDRLQFYYFHKQNFTYYAQYFLQAIQRLKQNQGQMLSTLIHSNHQFTAIKKGEQFLLSLNYKEKYQNSFYLTRNRDGVSFLTNQTTFLYYNMPILLLIYLIYLIIFRLTFSCRISKHFRKYCFFGLILIIIFEGNIQQFTFFYFLQLKEYFSANFTHKIVNIFIILLGFLIFFFSIGIMLMFKWYYQKLSKYFIENLRFTICSFTFISLQNGIIPLISGIIHAFYFEKLLNVTILLILMQVIWVAARIHLFSYKIFGERYKVIINIINSFLRIIFLGTLYLYQSEYKTALMNKVHLYFMLSYLFMWIIQTIITFYFIGKDLIYYIYRSIKKICLSNKIDNIACHKANSNIERISRNNSLSQCLEKKIPGKQYVLGVPKQKSNFLKINFQKKVLVRDSMIKKIKIQDFP